LKILKEAHPKDKDIQKRTKPVLYHANFCQGFDSKKQRLEKNNLWNEKCVKNVLGEWAGKY